MTSVERPVASIAIVNLPKHSPYPYQPENIKVVKIANNTRWRTKSDCASGHALSASEPCSLGAKAGQLISRRRVRTPLDW